MKQKKGSGYMKQSANRQPHDEDKSTGLKGPSVNTRASRGKKTAPTPRSLGPRTA